MPISLPGLPRLIGILAMLLAFAASPLVEGRAAAMADNTQPGLLHAAGDYFATPDGKAVYVAGDHTWTDNVSYSATGPFDFNAYLNVLQGEGGNLVRYWAPDTFTNATNSNFGTATLDVFRRTGAGFAADGGPKFDLTQFNQAYFDHLRADVQAAASKGIYVNVMLFFDYNPPGFNYGTWTSNPWNGANNINGTTTDDVSVEQGADPHLLALQEAYVAKTLDTLHDMPNVLYEVANEARYDPATYAWQNTIIDFVHQYEASHGYLQHPVGMTSLSTTGSPTTNDPAVLNASLLTSHADWVSPTGNMYQNNPPDAPGTKVVIADSDHIFGVGGNIDWVWQQFTRGQNVLIMDDMSGTNLPGTLSVGLNSGAIANEVSQRLGVSETRQASLLVDMTNMKPSDSLSSTQFALANPAGGDYVVYAPGGGTISVNLSQSSGQTLDAQWMNIATGQLSAAGTVQGGAAAQGFTAPFSGAAALILTPHQVAGLPGPLPSPMPAPTPAADTLGINLSEDAWRGDAQFTVAVDGKQIGGVGTVDGTALRSAGRSELITLSGNFGAGPHDVAVSFINDDWGGTPSTDRNLYVTGLSYDGATFNDGASLLWNSTRDFTVTAPAAPPGPVTGPVITGPTLGGGADQIQLMVAEDAWRGDAQFLVSVDGQQIGGVQTVAGALHQAGQSETLAVNGNFGAGPHDVAVSFINDDWGGTPSTDRNLYVTGLSYDGTASGDTATMLWNSTSTFTVQGALSAPAITARSISAGTMTFINGGTASTQGASAPAPATTLTAALSALDKPVLQQRSSGVIMSQAKASSVPAMAIPAHTVQPALPMGLALH